MKLKILNKKDSELKLEIADTTPAFANSLRRTIITRTNTLAIDTIDLHINTSALYNEILAHRIGMIPLKFKDSLKRTDECTCEGKGCINCEVKLVLKKSGPCTVYSKDFKSTDKDIKPTSGKILIAKLLEDQEISLEATAKLGTWPEHAKWQSSNIGYQYYPDLKTSKDCDMCKTCAKACPKSIIDTTTKIKLKDNYECDLCGKCVDICPKKALTLTKDRTRIIFTVKSVSGLEPKDIVTGALKTLKSDFNELSKEIK
ncbi:MAG: DNA-directed RNA polymerase subunit D [Candidatus Aenigmarchaeota archaeon]|nr:DNA-directed RNA polymerase subunit D [Candidatus Aenigmarchaeota archaeon]